MFIGTPDYTWKDRCMNGREHRVEYGVVLIWLALWDAILVHSGLYVGLDGVLHLISSHAFRLIYEVAQTFQSYPKRYLW